MGVRARQSGLSVGDITGIKPARTPADRPAVASFTGEMLAPLDSRMRHRAKSAVMPVFPAACRPSKRQHTYPRSSLVNNDDCAGGQRRFMLTQSGHDQGADGFG